MKHRLQSLEWIFSSYFLLPFQDYTHWDIVDPLPSYGRGIEFPGGRYRSLINGQNLSDVVITGKDFSHISLSVSWHLSSAFLI